MAFFALFAPAFSFGASPTLSVVVPPAIRGGAETPGRVFLSSSAEDDVVVSLTSGSSRLRVPTTVVIPKGQNYAVFSINASAVTTNQSVTLGAVAGDLNATANTTISPSVTRAVSLGPEGYGQDFSTFVGSGSVPYGWTLAELTAPSFSAWDVVSTGVKYSTQQTKVFGIQPNLIQQSGPVQILLVRNDSDSVLDAVQITYTGRTRRGPGDSPSADREVSYNVSVNSTRTDYLDYTTEMGDGEQIIGIVRGLNIPAWSTFEIRWSVVVSDEQGFGDPKQIGLSDVKVEIPVPKLFLLPPGGWSDFTTTVNTPSEPRRFDISSLALTESITINASQGYEVSLSQYSGFNATVYGAISGNETGLVSFPVYARLNSPSEGSTPGTLQVSSLGAGTRTAPLGGTVFSGNIGVSQILPSQTVLDSFSANRPNPSVTQSFFVSARNLTNPVAVFAPQQFEVRRGNSGTWASAISVPLSSPSNLAATEIQVRMRGDVLGSHSGNISLRSGLLGNSTVAVDGEVVSPGPAFSVTGALDPFTSASGFTSAVQTLAVSGINLTANISVTAPRGFEVSTNGIVFGPDAVISEANGAASATLFIRIAANAPTGFLDGTLDFSSQGATAVSIGLVGTVGQVSPAIVVTGSTAAFTAVAGLPSAAQSLRVDGFYLVEDISIRVDSADFEVSTDNSTFGANATITQTDGLANGMVHIRVAATAASATVTGNLILTSRNATTFTIPLGGTVGMGVVVPPVIRGGVATPGRVFLPEVATGDVTVQLFSNRVQLSVPPTVVVRDGERFAEFAMSAMGVDANLGVRLDATSGNLSATANTTISAGEPRAVSLTQQGYGQDFAGFRGSLPLPYGWSLSGSAPFSAWGDFADGAKHSSDQVDVFGLQSGTAAPARQVLLVRNDTGDVLRSVRVGYTGRTLRSASDAQPADRDAVYSVSVAGTVVPGLVYNTAMGDGVEVTGLVRGLAIPPWSTFVIEWSASVLEGTQATKQIGISNVSVAVPSPKLSLLPPGGWSDFTTTFHTPSVPKLFYVSALDLAGPVTLNATAGYKVSLSPASGFNSTVSQAFSANETEVDTFPVYVRLDGTGNGTVAGELEVSSPGAETLTAPLGGVVFSSNLTQREVIPSRASLEPFTAVRPADSEPQSFYVSGRNLSGAVAIFAPPQFQVRLGTSGLWSSGVTIPRDAQNNLAPTQIQVRLKGEELGVHSGKVRLTSNLVEYSDVTVTGEVLRAVPTITLGGSFAPFSTTRGVPSAGQSFNMEASDLSETLRLRVPEGFELKLGNADVWSETLDIEPNRLDAVASTTVDIRIADFAPARSISGVLQASSAGAVTKELALSGAVTANLDPWISARPSSLAGFRAPTDAASDPQFFEVLAKNLEQDLVVTAPAGFQISTNGTVWQTNLQIARQNLTNGSNTTVTKASDIAANYSGNWVNDSNGGAGFGPWQIQSNSGNGSAGVFIGDPSAAGIGGMGSAGFGLFADPGGSGASATAERQFNQPLAVGDALAFQWGINFDSGSGGNKGFALSTSAGESIVVNNSNSATITVESKTGNSTEDTGFVYGTQSMTWTFTQTSNTTVIIVATPRGGGATFSRNVTTTGPLTSFKAYASDMQAGDEAQPYFNNFQITGLSTGVGDVPLTPLLVRLAGNQSVGTKSGNLSVTGAFAPSRQIALAGEVIDAPVLSVDPDTLENFLTVGGLPSDPQSFSLSGTSLVGNVSLSASPGLEIAQGNGNFSSNLSVAVGSNGSIAAEPIQVRIVANATAGVLNGTITALADGEFNRTANATVLITGLVGAGNATPEIFPPTLALLDGFRTTAGTESTEKTFVVSAAKLKGNLLATASAPYEVAVEGGLFGAEVSIVPGSDGFIRYQTLRVRISANATEANPLPGTVVLSTTGSANHTVDLQGIVDPTPGLQVDPEELSFDTTETHPSDTEIFELSGTNLASDDDGIFPVTITASGPFEVSLSGNDGTWQSSLQPTPATGSIQALEIHVRASGSAPVGNSTGTVTCSAPGVLVNATVALNAFVLPRPLITLEAVPLANFFAYVGGGNSNTEIFRVSGINLQGDITLAAPGGYEVSFDGQTWSDDLVLLADFQSGNTTNSTLVEIASDNAGNYLGGWTDGSNGGTGFGEWQIQVEQGTGFAGNFIGNPDDAGITGLGLLAFGLYANPGESGASATVSRTMPEMLIGDSFSFQWATNWDSNVGNKGFNILAGNQTFVNVNQGSFPGDITLNGVLAIDGASGYGTGPMTWTFTRTAEDTLLVTTTARDGSTPVVFSANITITATPDGFSFYTAAMGAGDQRQPYFNNLSFKTPQSTGAGGVVRLTDIHVRLITSGTASEPINGNITITSEKAETRLVALQGVVADEPDLVASPSAVGGLATKVDDLSFIRTGNFSVQAWNLRNKPIVLQIPSDFELRLSPNDNWTSGTLTVPASTGNITQGVEARVAPSASVGLVSGTVNLSTSDDFGNGWNATVVLNGSAFDSSNSGGNGTLAEVLDTYGDLNFNWSTTGQRLWFSQTQETHDGIDAAQSGASVGSGERSTIVTSLTGPGRLTFYWKVSCAPNAGKLSVNRGGTEIESITGEVGWEKKTVIIPNGTHTISWNYSKSGTAISGQDAAWLDQVEFVPGNPEPKLLVKVQGAPVPANGVAFRSPGLKGSRQVFFEVNNVGSDVLAISSIRVSAGGNRLSVPAVPQVSVWPGEKYLFPVTYTPDPDGNNSSGVLEIVSTDSDSPSNFNLNGSVEFTPLENWRKQWFNTYRGDSVDLLDTDGDGMGNLLEYAFGSNPISSLSKNPVVFDTIAIGAKRHLRLYIDRRREDIAYIVESSYDLNTWANARDLYEGVGIESPYFIDTYHDLNAPGQLRCFLRVKVQER